MSRTLLSLFFLSFCLWIPDAYSYWLMAASPFHDCLSDAPRAHFLTADNVLTTQRMDPIQYPGTVGSHVHSGVLLRLCSVFEAFMKARAVLGGSGFSLNLSTADLRGSECTSIPVQEDKSNYWYPVCFYVWCSESLLTSVLASLLAVSASSSHPNIDRDILRIGRMTDPSLL